MSFEPAPFYDEVTGGPPGGAAWWCETTDGVRIRVGYWPCEGARGTILMFPGRTEYIEKYGRLAAEMNARGYAMLAVDWRGQGLADRLLDDRRVGHVVNFVDYQLDVGAALALAHDKGFPRPFHLIGHSMGGGIGLRAAMHGLEVETCAFTGPMWGIYLSPMVKPFGWALPRMADLIGMGTKLPPSTSYDPYVLANDFDGNILTKDREMFAYMRAQLQSHPDLALGGPSLIWLREALTECKYLAAQPSPALPCICFLGEDEKIIDMPSVHDRMRRWPGGALDLIPSGEHEVLMEKSAIRGHIFDRLEDLFSGRFAADNAAA